MRATIGEETAMKSLVRAVATAAVTTLCGASVLFGVQPPLTLAPAIQLTFPLGNLPGLDPLVDPNTFFLIGFDLVKVGERRIP
jgi:hypothetical protein